MQNEHGPKRHRRGSSPAQETLVFLPYDSSGEQQQDFSRKGVPLEAEVPPPNDESNEKTTGEETGGKGG